MLSIGSAGPQTVNAGTPATYLIICEPVDDCRSRHHELQRIAGCLNLHFYSVPVPAGLGGVGVTLTINTTARTAAVIDLHTGPVNYRPLFPLLFLITAVLAAISMRHRLAQRRRLKPALALGGLLLLAALSGCGGGGGSKTTTIVQNPQGTPAGTYSITVTAISPNASASTPATLIVK